MTTVVNRPASVTSTSIGWFATFCLLTFFYYAKLHSFTPLATQILALFAFAIPVIVCEYFWRPNQIVRQSPAGIMGRIFHRSMGTYLSAAILFALFWLSPWYRDFVFRPFADEAVQGLTIVFGFTWFLLVPFYMYLVDRFVGDEKDGAYRLSRILFFNKQDYDGRVLSQYALGWAVKGFFLPLMLSYMYQDIAWFLRQDWVAAFQSFDAAYDILYRFVFFVDVTVVSAGYILALRLLDSHIRSTEPTASGWVVCILCYDPIHILTNRLIVYNDGYEWVHLFPREHFMHTTWGVLILLSVLIYVAASIQFGIRFSNLTNRGIITNGPYRWCKHPAYVSKVFSWWLMYVPFISMISWTEALRNTLGLALFSFVYYLRAKTEERHLRSDPAYVQYESWMAQTSLIARLRAK